QIHEAPRHRDVAGVECPHLIGAVDLHSLQQIRPDLVLLVAAALRLEGITIPAVLATTIYRSKIGSEVARIA
ncbi:hypothetical protein, partial [Paraburkholderia sp. BR14374]|uniref:hypothetical protein n=1 Tax=Paraburkholderia sp. BR14374 TaxID=3237007 RepID=UPI0034CF63BA